MRDADEHPDLPTQFTQFAKTVGREGGDVYQTISLRLAREPSLRGLLDLADPPQRRPHLLLAAVHYLLLAGADDPLASHYPTVAHVRGRALPAAPAGDPGQLFVAFCATHRSAIEALVSRRATQTNEVGRCAGLLPALSYVAGATGAPLSVVDLGASAGLNLLFDRYAYSYAGADGDRPVSAGDPMSAVRIRSTLRGDAVPPLALPAVARRAGVDLRPADPTDPDQARWLLACLWPHDLARFTRLESALTLAAAVPPAARPVVTAGDLVGSLPVLAAAAPAGSELCLVHSWVAAYLSVEEQRALARAVGDVARGRRVWWIFAESPFEAPELPFAPAPGGRPDRGATVLMVVRLDAQGRRAHRLADMHYHGAWLHWWGDP